MGNRRPQQVVRAGQFQRRLEEVQVDLRRTIAADMALVLAEFHGEWVQPVVQENEYLAARNEILADRVQELRTRVRFIETVTGIRLGRRMAAWLKAHIRVYRTDRVVDIAELAPDPVETEVAAS